MTNKFLISFAKWFVLLNLLVFTVLFSAACTAAWITAYPALVAAAQAALTAIGAFIAALSGISDSAKATVQKVINDAITQLGNSVAILKAAAGNVTAGVIAQIEAILQAILPMVQQILSGLSITNPTTLGKLTNIINLAIAAIEAVLALLPAVKVALPRLATMTDDEKEAVDATVTKQIKAAHKALQKNYQAALQMTGDMATDEAIMAMKKVVPSIP